MARPFIVLGDKHSHDGTVTSALTIAATAGKGIARNKKVKRTIHRPNHIADGEDTIAVEGAGLK